MEKVIGLEYEKGIIMKWLSVFINKENVYPEFKNALFITGNSGVGKTYLIKSVLESLNFDIFEHTALEVRSEKTIHNQLNDLMGRKSVLQMINPKWKSAIILDELEAMDYRERSSSNIIKSFIEFSADKKKVKTIRINSVPLILISTQIDKWMKPLLKDCILIEIGDPSAINISLYWSIRYPEIKIPIEYLPRLIELVSNDYRKAEQVADWLSMYNTKEGLSPSDIEKVLLAMGKKEIDISNITALQGILIEPKDLEERIILGSTDYTYLPWIIMENYPKTIKTYYNIGERETFELMKKFYYDFIDGQQFNNGLFGNWDLLDVISTYWGVMPYTRLKEYERKTNIKSFEIEVSSVNSRYSFKNINHRAMIPLMKKLDVSYEQLQIISNQYIDLLENGDIDKIRTLVMKHIGIGWEINDLERILKMNLNFEYDNKLSVKIKVGLMNYNKIWKTVSKE